MKKKKQIVTIMRRNSSAHIIWLGFPLCGVRERIQTPTKFRRDDSNRWAIECDREHHTHNEGN